MSIGFLDVLINVAVMVGLAVPGFVCRKCRIFGEGSISVFSGILLYACAPFLTIMSFQGTPYSAEILWNMLWTVLLALAQFALVYGVAHLATRRFPGARRGVARFASLFCNSGYMGVPFLYLLGLGECVLYAATYMAVFNVVTWTLGTYLLSGDRKNISFRRAFLNPATVAMAVALPLFLCRVDLAAWCEPVYRGLKMLSDMTTPAAMMLMGVRLAEMKPKEIFGGGQAYLVAAIRLLMAPALCFLLVYFLPVSAGLKVSMLLIAAMPTATATASFTDRFGGDMGFAVQTLLLSTLLSVVTIPVVSLLLGCF